MWPFTIMSKKDENPRDNKKPSKESANDSSEVKVRIIVPKVAEVFGSADGLFIRELSESESEVFVNGEIRVMGNTTFEKVE